MQHAEGVDVVKLRVKGSGLRVCLESVGGEVMCSGAARDVSQGEVYPDADEDDEAAQVAARGKL